MSKSRAVFWGILALPLLYAMSCSGRVSNRSVSMADAGSAGMAVDAPPVHDSGLRNTDCSKLTVGQCAAGNDCQVLEAQLQSPRCASDFEAVGCAAGETIAALQRQGPLIRKAANGCF